MSSFATASDVSDVLPDDQGFTLAQTLRKFVGRTKDFEAVTVCGDRSLVTFFHGMHETWKLHDEVQVWIEVEPGVEKEVPTKVVAVYPEADFILLNTIDTVLEFPHSQPGPLQGQSYLLLGRSDSYSTSRRSICHGIILTETPDVHGRYRGDTGCWQGDNGGGIFSFPQGMLLGMNLASEASCLDGVPKYGSGLVSVVLPMLVMQAVHGYVTGSPLGHEGCCSNDAVQHVSGFIEYPSGVVTYMQFPATFDIEKCHPKKSNTQ